MLELGVGDLFRRRVDAGFSLDLRHQQLYLWERWEAWSRSRWAIHREPGLLDPEALAYAEFPEAIERSAIAG